MQYYGDPIYCQAEGLRQEMMDMYCWVAGTFTIPAYFNSTLPNGIEAVHPGIGFYDKRRHTKIYHR